MNEKGFDFHIDGKVVNVPIGVVDAMTSNDLMKQFMQQVEDIVDAYDIVKMDDGSYKAFIKGMDDPFYAFEVSATYKDGSVRTETHNRWREALLAYECRHAASAKSIVVREVSSHYSMA